MHVACVQYARYMAEIAYTQIRITLLMARAIDQFLETEIAQKNGVTSRNDFVMRVISGWFSQYEKDFGIFVPRAAVINTSGQEVPKPFD